MHCSGVWMVFDRTPENLCKVASTIFVCTMLFSKPAHAYIDPGLAYVLMQGLMVSLLGAGLAWILQPWKFLLRVFGRRKPDASEQVLNENASDDEADGTKQ